MGRGIAHPKRPQMSSQTSLASKTFSHHICLQLQWHSMTKPNSNNALLLTQFYSGYQKENFNPVRLSIYKKIQEINNFIPLKPVKEKHTHTTNTNIKITGSNNHWTLVSLNINVVNSTVKRHRLKGWIHKQNTSFCSRKGTNRSNKDSHYLNIKG